MQIDAYNKDQILDLIRNSKSVAVIPSKVSGADSFFAAVGLYFMLKDKNPNVKFVYTGKIPDEALGSIDEADIASNLAQRDLLISIDYGNTPATKVQYSTENETFYLRIGPVPRDFDKNKVHTKITGFDFDLVITVGARELADLGPIYNNLMRELLAAKKINIDNTNQNTRFGIINVIDTAADSLSALVFQKAAEWELTPTKRASVALLKGMTYKNGVSA